MGAIDKHVSMGAIDKHIHGRVQVFFSGGSLLFRRLQLLMQ